jgi:hypothetical protein
MTKAGGLGNLPLCRCERARVKQLDNPQYLLQYAIVSRQRLGRCPLPPLIDPRHEAFAVARARGANRKAAYVEAGFAPHRSGGSKLAARTKVAARIAELEQEAEAMRQATVKETIVRLMGLAEACAALKSAAGLKEAREARLEASRLLDRLERESPRPPQPYDKELTQEEWVALYGAPAPG